MTRFSIDHHLSQCSSASGKFAILAIDHRANLVADMAKVRSQRIGYRDVVAFKQTAIRHLAEESTAVLTDPTYGFPGLIASGVPASFGLLAPLEVTDYSLHPSRRTTDFVENWGVAKIKKAGCSGVKLLLYYHPEAENAGTQTDIVDRIVEECQQHALPFFLEPISYSLDPNTTLQNHERAEVVVETARHFSQRGVDVLKVEFPLDTAAEPDERTWLPALEALNEACSVPWALLSAGVPFDVFLKQTVAACKAGASGVIVGRAVWAEGVPLQGQALEDFMSTTARARLRALADVCDLYSTPWPERTKRPALDEHWYYSL